MLAYTAEALGVIARHYMAATGAPAVRLGLLIAANQRLISNLIAGRDCTTENALAASDWFDAHWPEDAAWPEDVPRRPLRMLARRGCNGRPARARGKRNATMNGTT